MTRASQRPRRLVGRDSRRAISSLRFFESAELFRRWLEKNHASADELWIGYYRKTSGRPSMTWSDSVDEALCFGWIDGIRKAVDETSYTIRFTSRRKGSIWSAINIRKAQRLIETGRMRKVGLAAFEARQENRSAIYSYENRPRELPESSAKIFRRKKSAWKFYQAQPPGYQRMVTWWIVSARTPETQQKRLARLIAASVEKKRI